MSCIPASCRRSLSNKWPLGKKVENTQAVSPATKNSIAPGALPSKIPTPRTQLSAGKNTTRKGSGPTTTTRAEAGGVIREPTKSSNPRSPQPPASKPPTSLKGRTRIPRPGGSQASKQKGSTVLVETTKKLDNRAAQQPQLKTPSPTLGKTKSSNKDVSPERRLKSASKDSKRGTTTTTPTAQGILPSQQKSSSRGKSPNRGKSPSRWRSPSSGRSPSQGIPSSPAKRALGSSKEKATITDLRNKASVTPEVKNNKLSRDATQNKSSSQSSLRHMCSPSTSHHAPAVQRPNSAPLRSTREHVQKKRPSSAKIETGGSKSSTSL